MKPVEGTILTVAKDAASVDKAQDTEDCIELMEHTIQVPRNH